MSNKSFSQFVCLSGMPRSGSTLLSAILSQNPLIHAEGNSALCQLMWDMQVSCLTTANEQLRANRRENTMFNIITQIPHVYYKDIPETIVVDKCRSWTLKPNIDMLHNYIDKNVKVIVLERPVVDVVKSFAKLYKANNIYTDELANKLITPNSEPIMRSLEGIKWAKINNTDNTFIFINYDELVKNTQETIGKIYDFCGWTPFNHDFNNIVSKYPENDDIYKLHGQHEIRSTINKKNNKILLDDILYKKCTIIDKLYKL